jgi:hypothetical protein
MKSLTFIKFAIRMFEATLFKNLEIFSEFTELYAESVQGI